MILDSSLRYRGYEFLKKKLVLCMNWIITSTTNIWGKQRYLFEKGTVESSCFHRSLDCCNMQKVSKDLPMSASNLDAGKFQRNFGRKLQGTFIFLSWISEICCKLAWMYIQPVLEDFYAFQVEQNGAMCPPVVLEEMDVTQ